MKDVDLAVAQGEELGAPMWVCQAARLVFKHAIHKREGSSPRPAGMSVAGAAAIGRTASARLIEGISAPGCSRDQHLLATQFDPVAHESALTRHVAEFVRR